MAKKRRPYEPRVAPPTPSREEVEERLLGVVEGRLSRDEADRWAMQWVAADDLLRLRTGWCGPGSGCSPESTCRISMAGGVDDEGARLAPQRAF
jgi:hypothetical protein